MLFASSNSYCTKPEDVIIIGGEKNYPPFEYIDEEGEFRGFNVDLMKALALQIGIDIKLVPMDWVDAHISLQNGEIDAIQGMNYNDARFTMYDFSEEYLKNSLVCFVRKDDTEVLGLNSLTGKRAAVQRSDFAAYALADQGEIEVVFFSNLDDAFEKLIENEVDAVVGNKLTGLYIIQKKKIEDQLKIVGNDISFTSYGMAFKKGNTLLINEFNTALESLKKNGIYYNIYEKWFGKEILPAWKQQLKVFYTLLVIIIAVILLNLLFIRMNNILKMEVEKRTIDLKYVNLELKRNQRIIKESDRYKEQILNGIGNGLITFDKNGYIITVNKSCENLLNINGRDYAGRKYDETDLGSFVNIHQLEECLLEEKQFILQEKKYIKDGKENILSYILKPLFDLNNHNIGAVVTINDITEITSLRKRLAESDKMNSLGKLISGISHEIRNPLTSIKTYIDLLPKKYDNTEFRDKITKELPNEIERLNELLTDLINYSKPKKFKIEKFDLRLLVNQTLDIFRSQMDKQEIKVNYLEEQKIQIVGDKQQIKQIIVNVLKNSIDAIMVSGEIVLELKKDNDHVVLSIIDDGIGIEEEDIDRIFDPFYTNKDNGTGLGLALCYQYARDNDIDIQVTSSPGEWTKVELIFNMFTG